jgi:polar amino acid transport system substrate-binding protein
MPAWRFIVIESAYNISMKILAGVMAVLTLSCPPTWASQDIVFVAATNNTMPVAKFDGRRLSGGIVKDLGDAIAARLGRQARYLDTPSGRVWDVLAKGQADGICYVLPEWAEGSFNWSRPVLPDAVVVVAHPSAPVLRKLKDLSGKPLGTVHGYHYPDVEMLGKQFVRDDAPTMEHNLNRILAGRIKYAIVEQTTLAYRQRSDPSVNLRTEVVFTGFKAQCAFSKRSAVPFASVDEAITGLQADGSIDKILARYR